jgi:GxxExxY protein
MGMNHKGHEGHKEHKGLEDGLNHLSSVVVAAGLEVHRGLGPGLLETANQHCLAHEFDLRGIGYQRQVALPITYKQTRLEAAYRLDLLVENVIVVEIKSTDGVMPVHRSQLLTYLRLSCCRLGFLMNFNTVLFKQGLERLVL